MSEAGYSGTPLTKKLGLRPGQAVAFIGVPDDLLWTAEVLAPAEPLRIGSVADLPDDVANFDLIWAFCSWEADLRAAAPRLKAAIKPAGALWLSWPKKAAKRPGDITEDTLRAVLLPAGLVDVKVCAVSAVWSGLKFVVPLAQRPGGR